MIELIVQRYRKELTRYVLLHMHRGKADAEDIVQEVYTIDIITKNNINGTVLSFILFSYVDIQTVNKQEIVEFLQRSVLPLIFLSGNGQHFVNYFK